MLLKRNIYDIVAYYAVDLVMAGKETLTVATAALRSSSAFRVLSSELSFCSLWLTYFLAHSSSLKLLTIN
jgi:hypothetical protein